MFKTKNGLYNLTIIDKDPDVKNIIYMGITDDWKKKIFDDFLSTSSALHFVYDLGEVLINKSTIHTIVFQEYESFEDMEYGKNPDDENTESISISGEVKEA